jgi:hypothetical protein
MKMRCGHWLKIWVKQNGCILLLKALNHAKHYMYRSFIVFILLIYCDMYTHS